MLDDEIRKSAAPRRALADEIVTPFLAGGPAPTLLLYGPPQAGKTFLLERLGRPLGADYAVSVVDCDDRAMSLCRAEGAAAAALYHVAASVRSALDRKRVRVGQLTPEALGPAPLAAFSAWLGGALDAAGSGLKFVLCFDQYERLRNAFDGGWGRGFLDLLRSFDQRRADISLVFAGRETFAEAGAEWSSRFSHARSVRVGARLSREEARAYAERPSGEATIVYEAGALDCLLDATGCHVYLLKMALLELAYVIGRGPRVGGAAVTAAEVDRALGEACRLIEHYVKTLRNYAWPSGEQLLTALAKGEAPSPDDGRFDEARALLRRAEVLGEGDEVLVPLIGRWMSTYGRRGGAAA